MNEIGLEFLILHIDDEWRRMTGEFSELSYEELTWQPAPLTHSMGWHVRHVIEWRYALVHVLICGHCNREQLKCLGWEGEPAVQKLASNPGEWYEPASSVGEGLDFAERIRELTNIDIRSLSPEEWWKQVSFPWRTGRLLDEVFQDVRHSAVHRGQIRELRKMYRQLSGRRENVQRNS
jgi:hypothetical protein